MAIRIALRWNKDPDWYYTQTPDTRIKLIAEYRLATEDTKSTKERHQRIKHDKLQKMIDKHRRLNG